jgi:hypothetical protein
LLILRDERKLKVFENRVLRRIFGRKRDEVTGEWGKLHNEELNNLYFSPSIVLEGKSEGKKPLGTPRRRWDDNIKMDLQEVGCWVMDWIGLAQDWYRWQTLLKAVMNLRVP